MLAKPAAFQLVRYQAQLFSSGIYLRRMKKKNGSGCAEQYSCIAQCGGIALRSKEPKAMKENIYKQLNLKLFILRGTKDEERQRW